MKISWIRGSETIDFSLPNKFFVLGLIGTAKSTFLETMAEEYLFRNQAVCDIFGSRDGEGLAWLRSKWVTSGEKKVLLVHGQNVDVKCSYDTKSVSDLKLNDFDNYDLIISSTPLYITPNQEFREVNRLLDLLYKRQSWTRLVYGITREAANLFYSRLRVSGDQLQAKAEAVYLIRESRHMGLALGLDSLKYTSIDIDMRMLTDFQIIKSLGRFGLPDDLKWLYSFIRPEFIRKMGKNEFVIITNSGAIGIGVFQPLLWHKQQGEHILKAVDVKVEYGEVPKLGEDRRTYKTIGDEEHAEIMALYLDEKQSMAKIEKLKRRSRSTIKAQIDEHDEAVTRSGFCPKCKRVNGLHTTQLSKCIIQY